jgi:hypothetical protein
MERAEAERNLHATIEHHRHEPPLIARASCLVAHERGLDRAARPHDDHHLCRCEFAFDHPRIVVAGDQRAVPPHVQAAPDQRFRKRTNAVAILAGVGDEKVGHAAGRSRVTQIP